MHTHIHTYMCTYIHVRTYIHTYTHTYTRTHCTYLLNSMGTEDMTVGFTMIRPSKICSLKKSKYRDDKKRRIFKKETKIIEELRQELYERLKDETSRTKIITNDEENLILL